MSRADAKTPYDRGSGEPATGYISPADAQASIDVIYTDMEGIQSEIGDPHAVAVHTDLVGYIGEVDARVAALEHTPEPPTADRHLMVDKYSGSFIRVMVVPPSGPWPADVDFALATTPGAGGETYPDLSAIAGGAAVWADFGGSLGRLNMADGTAVYGSALKEWIRKGTIATVHRSDTDPAHPNLIVESITVPTPAGSSLTLDALADVDAPTTTPAGKALGTTAEGQWGPVDYARVFVQATAPTPPREGDLWAKPAIKAVPTLVQEKAGLIYDTAAPFELSITLDAATTAGNAIVVNVGHANLDEPPTITDSAGNTYTLLARTGSADGSTNAYGSMFVALNANPATWVKSSVSVANKTNIVQVAEFSGVASHRATAKYVGPNPSLPTTNAPGDLIVCMCPAYIAAPPGQVAGAGYAALDDQYHAGTNAYSLLGAWRVADAADTPGASFTSVGTHGLITSSFAPKWEQ